MKFLIINIFFLFSVQVFAQLPSSCTEGECVEGIVQELEDLSSAFDQECMSSKESDQNIDDYFEENGISEKCYVMLNELSIKQDELRQIATELEISVEQNDVRSCQPNSSANELNSQIQNINAVNIEASCSDDRKAEVKKTCTSDLNCFMFASAMGMGGYVAEKLIPESMKIPNCNLGGDSCTTQLVTGFIKSVMTFFSGAWDLLKMAGNGIKDQANKFWNWVTDAEDHSSTSQLSMAEASEDDGVFSMLVDDFPGTMSKMWQGLVGSIKEWLKTDIFCEKWEGVPRFSKCTQPYSDFDCASCKTFATGLCAATGVIVAEIVPAFLTGGIVTAAKHGINGAAKIAKVFKVSSKAAQALKKTKMVSKVSKKVSRIDDIISLSSTISKISSKLKVALSAASKFLLSPISKKTIAIGKSLKTLSAKSKMFLAENAAGKVIHFSLKALKNTGKVIIYPIDNPLTTFAFKKGMTSMDKILVLGSKKISQVSRAIIGVENTSSAAYKSLLKIEEAKILNKLDEVENIKISQKYLDEIKPHREKIVSDVFEQQTENFDEIIDTLYPELKYGKLSDNIPQDEILAAEKEIWDQIKNIRDGPYKDKLIESFHFKIVGSTARARLVNKTPLYTDIIRNTKLNSKDRLAEALRITGNKNASKALEEALEKAHLIGDDSGVYSYTWRELRRKYKYLTDGGFSTGEADLLIRHGLAGRPPSRQLLTEIESKFGGHAEDILDRTYLAKRDQLLNIKIVEEVKPENLLARTRSWFNKRLGKKPTSDAQAFDQIESIYFIDSRHGHSGLKNIMDGSDNLTSTRIGQTYGDKEFKNYLNAKNYLLKESPELSIKMLKDVQAKMMEGGVEGLSPEYIGHFRKGGVYGGVSSSYPISDQIKDELIKNPYLLWIQDGSDVVDNVTQSYGKIIYPNSKMVTAEGLNIIKARNPALVSDIEEFQLLKKIQQKHGTDLSGKTYEQLGLPDSLKSKYKNKSEIEVAILKTQLDEFVLNEKLIEEMVEERFSWFKKARSDLGDIDSPAKLDEYVDMVSTLQRDLVSIHPFGNGNGRTTREVALNYLLAKEGFPPPRLINPNADIYKSAKQWSDEIKEGIIASDHLLDDLIERQRMGLSLENSAELVIPFRSPAISLNLKTGAKFKNMEGVEYIDPKLYREIIKRKIADNPMFGTTVENNPEKAWAEINKAAQETFSENNIYYNHAKHGIERVEIGYVDQDFLELFGKASFDDAEKFNFKMNQWYDDRVVWRGLASKAAEKSESDILLMFKELNRHMASNAVLRNATDSSPQAIRKAALMDFTKYNDDVFGDGLIKMAKDHSETGPMYGMSYGYSTSKNREVGKAFSMGAMVIAEYGSHKTPELQALLKSRILVGARKAHKDVDLGRLKQLRPEFSYKYGRQQEVMGIGASDPDAITIIQRIDADGSVLQTYLRNPKHPEQVWLVKGDIRPGEVPTSENLIRTIDLTTN